MALLITGFGRFPGVRVNPTARLAADVAARLTARGSVAARAVVLPVRYDRALAALAEADARWRPEAVLMLGLAARARWVRVERYGRRSSSVLHPDAAGRAGGGPLAGSAQPLTATAALGPALAALRRAGVRTQLSASAGRYLCNAAYAAQLAAARGRPVLFVHVPWPRPAPGQTPRARVARWRPGVAQLGHALRDVAAQLRRAARLRP
jgi:pyroglutamyl-peptidase